MRLHEDRKASIPGEGLVDYILFIESCRNMESANMDSGNTFAFIQ